MENIYANVNAETVKVIHDPNIETQDVTSGGMARRQRFARIDLFRGAVVCLGLLCVLLLAGIIGLCVHYNKEAFGFEEEHTKLLTERDQLQTERDQLQTERDKLQTERDQLQTERDQLQTERDQLQTERDQLQTERDQLQGERDNLQNKFLFMEQQFKMGWSHFGSSFYLVSIVEKTWGQSRNDCLMRGADLVIINSREEQNFIQGFKGTFWIGLSDRETEGSWKWVDGTPLTIKYWISGEPNSFDGEEDCAESRFISSNPEKTWNDVPCGKLNLGICEKVAYP